MENNELHPHAEVWDKLPTETLAAERGRIGEQLTDLISKSETIELIISERAELPKGVEESKTKYITKKFKD